MKYDLLHPNRHRLLTKWGAMLEQARGISQWTTDSELAWLCELATHCHTAIAEVGSYKGKSAKALSWSCPGKVYCVDRFQDHTRKDFEHNLAKELETGKVTLLPMESGEASEHLISLGVKLDAVFIDGSHARADVIRDLDLWMQLVREGGLICGHDCFPGEEDNGISQALDEVRPDYHLVIDSIFAFFK